MDFNHSEKSIQLLGEVRNFMNEFVYPIEEDIYNTVEREIGLGLSGKVIQLLSSITTISFNA